MHPPSYSKTTKTKRDGKLRKNKNIIAFFPFSKLAHYWGTRIPHLNSDYFLDLTCKPWLTPNRKNNTEQQFLNVCSRDHQQSPKTLVLQDFQGVPEVKSISLSLPFYKIFLFQ